MTEGEVLARLDFTPELRCEAFLDGVRCSKPAESLAVCRGCGDSAYVCIGCRHRVQRVAMVNRTSCGAVGTPGMRLQFRAVVR